MEAKYNNNPIETKCDEIVNSYNMFDCDYVLMDFDEFMEMSSYFDKQDDMSKETFREWFDENTCSDWRKMDRNGKCCYPTNKEWDKYWNDNFEGLWELPYHKKVIQHTIEAGCSNRMESVRYSNFSCEWIKRTREMMSHSPKSACN